MIQLIKLKNNLDIITEIRSKNEKSIVLHRPFVVQSMSIPSPMGVRVVQMIRPWIENTNENNVTLPSDAVLLSVSPDIELVRKYQFALEKEDVAQDIAAEIQNDPEQLQGFIERLVREELDEMDESPSPQDDIEERLQDADGINVSFNMSPGMFFHFLANGIMGIDENHEVDFDTDAFMEKFEEFKKQRREKPSPPKKRPPPKRDDWDFGNQFDDWDPEP